MTEGQDHTDDLVVYEKPTWSELVIHLGLLPIELAILVCYLFWLVLGIPVRQAFREVDAKPPRVLVDHAFALLEARMKNHGFVREGKKRQLLRCEGGISDRIGYSLGNYNEKGLSAEFHVWFSTTAPPPPIRIRWRSGDMVLRDPESGDLTIETSIDSLQLIQRVPGVNLYPRFLRTYRMNKAAKLAERRSLPWFEAKRT